MTFATDLLGTFVGWRSSVETFFIVIVFAYGQSEIGNVNLASFSLNQNIRWFDISMDNFVVRDGIQSLRDT